MWNKVEISRCMKLDRYKYNTCFLVEWVLIIYSFWIGLGLEVGSPEISVEIYCYHLLPDTEVRNGKDLGIVGTLNVKLMIYEVRPMKVVCLIKFLINPIHRVDSAYVGF
jgi:hypothetical protein